MNKSELRDRIIDHLLRSLETQTSAAHLARDEAISEESRAENRFDTHSQEAAYLAEGQARLAAGINAAIAAYRRLPLADLASGEPIAVGALLELGDPSAPRYFLGPGAGGLELAVAGRTVLVVTPGSPLGRELLGKRTGDRVRLPGRANRMATIVAAR